jgi:hypothetical protein
MKTTDPKRYRAYLRSQRFICADTTEKSYTQYSAHIGPFLHSSGRFDQILVDM